MEEINAIFDRIHIIIHVHNDAHSNIASMFMNLLNNTAHHKQEEKQYANDDNFETVCTFFNNIFKEISDLSAAIQKDETLLISVKNQKLLRTCFQLITSLGLSPCLIPGLGISMTKRCMSATYLSLPSFSDQQKYELLVACTDFFQKCFKVPVLKKIIITFHLSDYIAALIQLSFAPLKKPGVYKNYTMTQEMYNLLNKDRQKYVKIYEELVANCFQPILMRELLVLQSGTDPCPPAFAKRVIAKEMSQRLLAPGGLLSLMRCFIETHEIDSGLEWKKIDTICRIVAAKHGNDGEEEYLTNICSQLSQISSLNNTHFLATAVACILILHEKYPQSEPVNCLTEEIFQAFDYNLLALKSNLPGTIILSPQEVEQKVNIIHASFFTKLEWPYNFVVSNIRVLFHLGIKCTNNEELQCKLTDIILKCLEKLTKNDLYTMIINLFFEEHQLDKIAIEQFESGLAIKSVKSHKNQNNTDGVVYFITLFRASSDSQFVQNVFGVCLDILLELNSKRKKKCEVLYSIEDRPILLDSTDEKYANVLQMLSEISTSPKVVSALKTNPSIVINFIEHFISSNPMDSSEECVTIALVLLTTVLSNADHSDDLKQKLLKLKPTLQSMSRHKSDINSILCDEALSLISSEEPQVKETAYSKAVADVFDNLLPVRAHGIMELTKLIEAKDPETISKKHYVFCLFQEQLKDEDSYIYLSAINGIAALGTHCTEDVLQILCKEFLQISTERYTVTKSEQSKIAELRMKVGDVIVKVTKRLGEMATQHKTLLLNTALCGCRDDDPMIRTSALSNLAEIALVLHYRIGSIIYEVLLCVWSTIETDKAIECRRAAVMVISSLLKGLGKETLVQLKENLLPIYRTLKQLYTNENEDTIVRLHAQLALEELNEIVSDFLMPELKIEKQIFVLDKPEDIFK